MSEFYSREESRTIKTGLYALLAIVIVASLTVWGRQDTTELDDGQSYEIKARFGRTDGLLVGDLVRMAGVNIGKVVDAQLDKDFRAILTLDINENIHIPDDSSASIVSSGIMGKKYIEIEPGGSFDFISPGGEFSYTQDAMVVEELIDRIISIGKANKSENK